ncbi:MAG TPA: hypothetical protein VLQ45_27935 [Thermoanaerobaculia bacterium]|nr:hypothetical protein [Thermoanaerobaculia bacterium]
MDRLPYVWDYDIDEPTFRALLEGRTKVGRLDRDWAAVRLLEYATYREIVRLLGFRGIVEGWPGWRSRVRSDGRRRGFDFLIDWLPQHHPELLESAAFPKDCKDTKDSRDTNDFTVPCL